MFSIWDLGITMFAFPRTILRDKVNEIVKDAIADWRRQTAAVWT
jgi:hypothetical protein